MQDATTQSRLLFKKEESQEHIPNNPSSEIQASSAIPTYMSEHQDRTPGWSFSNLRSSPLDPTLQHPSSAHGHSPRRIASFVYQGQDPPLMSGGAGSPDGIHLHVPDPESQHKHRRRRSSPVPVPVYKLKWNLTLGWGTYLKECVKYESKRRAKLKRRQERRARREARKKADDKSRKVAYSQSAHSQIVEARDREQEGFVPPAIRISRDQNP
ncbi:hypothetical protein BU24DRAFT_142671 [Aaosphaeria arxii CBS 175.79]|uniref:Uncharacterized protein n=1 Tax=Aaosphaeria arxii CBS 175.79 TaxID=1450172 RepID=A0A6A5XW44_9PLEO|nr:uncharacterized protein BU24DRAFT_142671 [Aaosphaeria arxii CBS 175.79]KAF2017057.1 hypothetical protein BU24DRAFT_142671 [Aaosphaeria arxii CBS 175.79]